MGEFGRVRDRLASNRAKVSIAIAATDESNNHIGILHVHSEIEYLLHLRWHRHLDNVPESEPRFSAFDYFHVNLSVNASRLVQVAAKCRLIWKANQKGTIPYGFSDPFDAFEPTKGDYLFGPTRHGLTCSSFVIAVFHSAGLKLILPSTWPRSRSDDEARQHELVRDLEKYGAESQHVEAVRNEIGSVRYRPEDVAGAAMSKVFPAKFDFASERGTEINKAIRTPRCTAD